MGRTKIGQGYPGRLPTIEIPPELYAWILRAKDTRHHVSLADLVRAALREYCAPHLTAIAEEAKESDSWPIQTFTFTCPECIDALRGGSAHHCGGGILKDQKTGEDLLMADPLEHIRQRWDCKCYHCCGTEPPASVIVEDLNAIVDPTERAWRKEMAYRNRKVESPFDVPAPKVLVPPNQGKT